MDAVTLLRNDHKTVEGLFKKFEKAGPNAHKTKKDLVEKIVDPHRPTVSRRLRRDAANTCSEDRAPPARACAGRP